MNAGDVAEGIGDVNAVVSYNVGVVRDRWGWTQDQLLGRLARLTEAELSQTAVSAVAAAFDPGPRRFDAHELYLLSVVFEVPITYFFVPPPREDGPTTLADTGRPIVDLYGALLGRPHQVQVLDERLARVDVVEPDGTGAMLGALFGITGGATTWPEHYRVWREDRLRQLSRDYGRPLRDVSWFLGQLARELSDAGLEAALAGVEADADRAE